MTGILAGFVGATYSSIPGAPTSVSASASSSSAISVSFTAPACNGGLSIDSYQVVCTSSGTNSATGSSSPISVTGLSAATSYTFKVRAHNSIGYSSYSSSTGTATTQVTASSSSYTSPGTYTFTAPTGVTSVSAVAIGGGGAYSGCGGWLGYKNNISTSPGSGYTVYVGAGGIPSFCYSTGHDGGGNSYFINTSTVKGGGGAGGFGGWYCYSGGQLGFGGRTGDGGGRGGHGYWCLCAGNQPRTTPYNCVGGIRYQGGGGAGGYSGAGGNGATLAFNNTDNTNTGGSGSGGAGGGGVAHVHYYYYCGDLYCQQWMGGGGGVGIFGQGASGGGSGCGGSGGSAGGYSASFNGNFTGGSYGGGGGHGSNPSGNGGPGAVRVIWPGSSRSFPSTCAGSP